MRLAFWRRLPRDPMNVDIAVSILRGRGYAVTVGSDEIVAHFAPTDNRTVVAVRHGVCDRQVIMDLLMAAD